MLKFLRKIEFKIALIIMSAFVGLIFFASLYTYSKFSDYLKQQALTSAMQVTEQLNISLNSYIHQISSIPSSAYTDKSIYNILTSDSSEKEYLNTEENMQSYFNNIIISRTEVSAVAICLKNGKAFFSNSTLFRDFDYNLNYSLWKSYYLENMSGGIAILPSPEEKLSSSGYFILIKELRAIDSKEIIGYMIFLIDKGIKNSLINNIYFGKDTNIVIVNKNNKMILVNENASVNTDDYLLNSPLSKKNDSQIIKQNRDQILVVNNKSEDFEFRTVGFFSLKQLLLGQKSILNINIYSISVTLILSLLVSVIISIAFSKNINKIVRKLERVSNGKKNIDFRTKDNNEIARISNAIASMLDKIKEMTDKQFEDEKRANIALLKIKEAEFTALQNQINPHFLYNTLDSIRMKALINKDKEVTEMVQELSKLFRISISRGRNVVSVGEELEYAKCYFKVQKFRFNNRLSAEFNIDEKILDLKVIKLILQPIVENAIIHGLEPKLAGGVVKIKGFVESEIITFEVSDNGCGIKKDKLQELILCLSSCDSDSEKIGLLNVNSRIKNFYGEKFGITLKSEETIGTCVTLTVPQRRE